jgi:serine/threonine protein kinase
LSGEAEKMTRMATPAAITFLQGSIGNSIQLRPLRQFDNNDDESIFQLEFQNAGRSTLQALMILQAIFVGERIYEGYGNIPPVAGDLVVGGMYYTWGDIALLVLYLTRVLVSCWPARSYRKVWFALISWVCISFIYCETFIPESTKENCWLVPSIMLELLAVLFLGLIFRELMWTLLLILFSTTALELVNSYGMYLGPTPMEGYQSACWMGLAGIPLHTFFVSLVFCVLSSVGEMHAREEFVLKKRLRIENIKFKTASDPFTAANIATWVKDQLANNFKGTSRWCVLFLGTNAIMSIGVRTPFVWECFHANNTFFSRSRSTTGDASRRSSGSSRSMTATSHATSHATGSLNGDPYSSDYYASDLGRESSLLSWDPDAGPMDTAVDYTRFTEPAVGALELVGGAPPPISPASRSFFRRSSLGRSGSKAAEERNAGTRMGCNVCNEGGPRMREYSLSHTMETGFKLSKDARGSMDARGRDMSMSSANPLQQWQIASADIVIHAGDEGRLGEGGQGKVYRGEYGVTQQAVAAKELNITSVDAGAVYGSPRGSVAAAETEAFFSEFAVETAVLAKICHPHIVHFYGIAFVKAKLYMVSELCEGTLRDLIVAASDKNTRQRKQENADSEAGRKDGVEGGEEEKKEGQLEGNYQEEAEKKEEEEMDPHSQHAHTASLMLDKRAAVQHVGRCICSAMIYLSKKKVAHGDLKPANVLYNSHKQRSGQDYEDVDIKLCDFGLARMKRRQDSGVGRKQIGGQGALFTPYYAAPEIIRGYKTKNVHGEKQDVFSFGIIFFQLCTQVPGNNLYGNLWSAAVLDKVTNEALRPKYPENRHVALADKRIIEKCWADDPKARPTFAEIAMMLRKRPLSQSEQ